MNGDAKMITRVRCISLYWSGNMYCEEFIDYQEKNNVREYSPKG
jgi:hypothetical protein